MKKKIFMVMAVSWLIFSFCSCGNNTNTKNVEISEEQVSVGSRNNPYHIGDTIELSNITPYLVGSYEDVSFNLVFTVNNSYSIDEGISIRESRYDTFTTIPAANVTFKLTGNYDDMMLYSNIFEIVVVDEKMQTSSFISIEDDNQTSQHNIYTEAEYTVNILQPFNMETYTSTEAKYYVLKYRDNNKEEKSIYIAADNMNNEKEEQSDNISERENTSYENAIKAEEKGYYTIAMNLFYKTLDYKDSQEHYNNLKNILEEYNGTYYGESTQYENVKVYLYIDNGNVTAQFDGQAKSPDEYELYLYGETEDNIMILAFAPSRSNLFSIDTNTSYGDGFAIQKLDDGSYLVAATQGSTSYSWNGFYYQISDTVE